MVLAAAAAGAAQPAATHARRESRKRLGILCATGEGENPYFLGPLRDLGWVPGRTVELWYRRADDPVRHEAHARELAASPVDAIVAASMVEALAARRATTSVPIVVLYALAPVELGLVASLAHPGGNVTGTVGMTPEMAGKSIDLLREAVPSLRRLAVLLDNDPWAPIYRRRAADAAAARGLVATMIDARDRAGLERGFEQMRRERPDAVLVMPEHVFHTETIVPFLEAQRLPAMWNTIPSMRGGALMAYAPNMNRVYARAAAIADRVLRGTPPSQIPIELPTHVVFAVSKGAARRIGLELPRRLLLQAERVYD